LQDARSLQSLSVYHDVSGPKTFALTAVWSSEPDTGLGDGDNPDDNKTGRRERARGRRTPPQRPRSSTPRTTTAGRGRHWDRVVAVSGRALVL